MKRTRTIATDLAGVLLFLSSMTAVFAQPQWASNYPSIQSGASSADISVQLNTPGTVYYVIKSSNSTLTAEQIKKEALSPSAGQKGGKISVAKANTVVSTSLSGIKDGTTYTFYFVAEDSSKLAPDNQIKSISRAFPLRQTSNSFRSKYGPNALVGYLAYVPEAYYKNPNAQFPVLLMLHGMDEKVWNPTDLSGLKLVRKYGPAMLIDQGQEFPFIVITPQCPFGGWDDVSQDNFKTSATQVRGGFINEILDVIESKYRVDKSREYMTGVSMGAGSVWAYLGQPNNRIAAAIPISGWGEINTARTIASQNVGVWAFQGALDGAGSLLSLVTAINSNKPKEPVKTTIYAGLGHKVWDITYNNTGPGIAPDNIYDWLMRHSLGSTLPLPNVAPKANAGADKSIFLPVDSLLLEGSGTDSDGKIVSYAWTQKSGPSIQLKGTNSARLTLMDPLVGSYEFLLTVKDDDGAIGKDSVVVEMLAEEVEAEGNGLNAEYFNSMSLDGPPVLARIEPIVDFNWGSGSPDGKINKNQFGSRWSGWIEVPHSGVFTFYTSSDDGVRLWVDSQALVSNWKDHASTLNSGSISLTEGTRYEIKMEYYENCCLAEARLWWSSAGIDKQIVPTEYLFPTNASAFAAAPTTSSALQVYPIPASNSLTVAFESNMAGTVSLRIVDSYSQTKLEKKFSAVQGSNSVDLDVSSLAIGSYTLQVTAPDNVSSSRVLIAR